MARPSAKELTERELEVMHVFWNAQQATVAEIRDRLATAGRDLAYTTVATLVRILSEKGFLKQINDDRPFQYRPVRSYEEVSRSILGDLVERVFRGSREQLLLRLVEERKLSRQRNGPYWRRSSGEKNDEYHWNRAGMVCPASHADRAIGKRAVYFAQADASCRGRACCAHRPGDGRIFVDFWRLVRGRDGRSADPAIRHNRRPHQLICP